MNLKLPDLVDDIVDIAELIAPLIHPAAPAAIEAGKRVLGLADKIKATLKEPDADALTQRLASLESSVLAHGKQTAANLRR